MPPSKSRHPLLIGLDAARANVIPGAIVQTAIILVVVAYYWHEPSREVFAALAEAKARLGYWFSFFAAVVAGAILPELLTIFVFQHGKPARENLGNLHFNAWYWGLDGVLVDAFYRLQGAMFGNDVNFPTVAAKVAVDMLLFNPLYAAPVGLVLFAWKHHGYSRDVFPRVLTLAFYKSDVIPALVATWAVWVPVTAGVYSLPPLLQVPLFALALTFWVMMFTYITRSRAADRAADMLPRAPRELQTP